MSSASTNGGANGEGLIDRQAAAGPGQPINQRFAIEILHVDEVDLRRRSAPRLTTDVVDRADVRMRQGGNRACLPLETLAQGGIAGNSAAGP